MAFSDIEREYQAESDFHALYGLSASLSYIEWVGLYLNLDRQRVRKAMDQMTTDAIRTGETGVPEQWFHFMTSSPEEAASLRRSRLMAEAKAEAHRSPHGYRS